MSTADGLYSFENLWRQYRACRRHKRNTVNALAFELDAESNLLALQEELRSHTYRPGRSICFITRGPKPREVFAADFRDRIVHHVLVDRQEPIFERRFSRDSFACRKSKGTLAASDRLMLYLRQATANGHRKAWALKLDVASFFPSIDKQILYDRIASAMRDPELLWLTRTILFHDPTLDYRFRCLDRRVPPPGAPGYPVPERKSLFGKNGLCGLPIGNLTSQFWANVYLDVLDQLVKRTLRCPWYVRYVDDMVLLSTDRDQLVEWRGEIERCLLERLALELRPGVEELQSVSSGVDFVGWRTWWSHRLVRNRTAGNLKRALDRFERVHTRRAFGGAAQRVDVPASARGIDNLRATLASYGGHLRHGASWTTWDRAWCANPWLGALFMRQDDWVASPRWPTRIDGAAPYGARYRRLTRNAGERCLVFWPVGRYIEFHGPQRLLAERTLGLRRVAITRGDYALTAGFPSTLGSRFAERAIAAGVTVVGLVRPILHRCVERCVAPTNRLGIPQNVMKPCTGSGRGRAPRASDYTTGSSTAWSGERSAFS